MPFFWVFRYDIYLIVGFGFCDWLSAGIWAGFAVLCR